MIDKTIVLRRFPDVTDNSFDMLELCEKEDGGYYDPDGDRKCDLCRTVYWADKRVKMVLGLN